MKDVIIVKLQLSEYFNLKLIRRKKTEMLKQTLTILTLLIMTSVGFAQSIPSGTGRIEALANSPFILDAATDIQNNPAWNTQYRNYTFGDIGRNLVTGSDFQLSDQFAGVTFGVGKQWNLGMVINKRRDSWDLFNADTVLGPNRVGVSAPIVPFHGLIGYMMNKNTSIGLAPYITSWSQEHTDTDTSGSAFQSDFSSSSIGATLGILHMIKKGWIEGAVGFQMNKYKSIFTQAGTTQTVENNGGIGLSVNLRAWMYPKTGSKVAVVPVLGFSTYSFDNKLTAGTITRLGNKYSWLNVNGGVGLNWPVVDDIQLAFGMGVTYNSAKAEGQDSTILPAGSSAKSTDLIAPVYNFAGETRIADWLTARFGFSRSVDMSKVETVRGTTVIDKQTLASNPVNTISLGAGFHFGRFSLDATVSERWLKHGVNFISGGDHDLFGVISASYNFNK